MILFMVRFNLLWIVWLSFIEMIVVVNLSFGMEIFLIGVNWVLFMMNE